MKRLTGLIPPVVTIFDKEGHGNWEAMKAHADYMIRGGVDGLAYLGTSGEFSVMTQEAKKELIRNMVPYVKDRVQAVVGIGDTCLENSGTGRGGRAGRGRGFVGCDAIFQCLWRGKCGGLFWIFGRTCTFAAADLQFSCIDRI